MGSRSIAGVLVLAAVFISVLSQGPVRIVTVPRILFQGGTVRLLCRIEPDDNNRKLNMGIENYRDSEFTLEGRDAPAAFTVYYEHMPCEGRTSYCSLTRDIRGIEKVSTVSETLIIGGCEQSTSRDSYTTTP